MATTQNLLQLLQSRTVVDCDTMDVNGEYSACYYTHLLLELEDTNSTLVAKTLGPFVDCTSNQAIAFFEVQKPVHSDKLRTLVELAKSLAKTFPDVTTTELAVELVVR